MLLGGNKKRTLLQMIYAACALQKEYEIGELKLVWKKIIKKPYPGKIKQPVLTRWEFVGEAMVQFLKNKADYAQFAETTKNTYNVGHSRCDVASDFFTLSKENTLMTMAHYLRSFCKVWWLPNFIMLKQIDPIDKRSGHISRHVAAYYCLMKKV